MASQFTIIRDAGPPPPAKGGRGVSMYPFAELEVGDAFDAPRDGVRTKHGQDRTQVRVARSACAYVSRHAPSKKFTTRLVDEQTVRVWRTA